MYSCIFSEIMNSIYTRAGAGKSTFARGLAEQAGLPLGLCIEAPPSQSLVRDDGREPFPRQAPGCGQTLQHYGVALGRRHGSVQT